MQSRGRLQVLERVNEIHRN